MKKRYYTLCAFVMLLSSIALAQDEETTAALRVDEAITTESVEIWPRLITAYEIANVTTGQLEQLQELDAEVMRAPSPRTEEQMRRWAEARKNILNDEQLSTIRKELRRGLAVPPPTRRTRGTTETSVLAISTTASEER